MSLVGLKNAIAAVVSSTDKTPEQANLTQSHQTPYGTAAPDFHQDLERAESQLAKSKAESQGTGFLSKFDPRVMSDVIIGLSDGLTVPFALTAGLSSLGDSKLVITGGLAELVSGSISMGLGGFLAARSEAEYYLAQVKSCKQEFFQNPDILAEEIGDVLLETGASQGTINSFLKDVQHQPSNMVDFVIRFGKGLEEPAEGRQLTSALTIGISYFLGGFIPLIPYFFTTLVHTGLLISVLIMGVTLFIFGYVKTSISLDGCGRWKKVNEGLQMMLIGGFAAGSAWALVKCIE
ncbi:hypothetical protein BABINDRAFT_36795 [Babjeviella inositovora NRRL Y-12698]|uniref:DUF125-domain-containing protein n=1 Tax=Babjeviella inositovora NRRL Y-12698 TaxID=984486 RepID=A0A1E3QQF6_9ASCO|nr:uncharacterized protein BABINDRAFT_36795 [Babjeviella inositovora NRRL Y-12698]ODQ79926.1 hypothetical protein BABINDRAFT_36795 [Babjeviella inositovora NRRL Y-12698]